MIWLLLILVFIWAIVAQNKANQLSASLKQVLETHDKLKKVSSNDKHELAVQDFTVDLLLKHLIRVHGSKKAAQIYIANLESAPHATDALEALYELYNLPKQYASDISLITYNELNKKEWNQKSADENKAKYRKMLLRNMITQFENVEDEMKSRDKRLEEIMNESNY